MNPSPLSTAYGASRAAALSGLPQRTIYAWAKKGIVVPSISPRRAKVWSLEDLIALRTVYWLRHPKALPDGGTVPASSLEDVAQALERLRREGDAVWSSADRFRLVVDRGGRIYTRQGGVVYEGDQRVDHASLDLFAPFHDAQAGLCGPDLLKPRPRLRILRGHLGGEPHVEGTRLSTRMIAALARQGRSVEDIVLRYPFVSALAVGDAIDLERQLEANDRVASAA